MAFTVREFRDLLRLLEEHPEWRDELRRVVLSEELLSLPGLVRELAEAQQRTEARLFDILDRAIAEGKLTESEADDVELADVIVRGRRREDEAQVYLVVEVSWGVGLSDVERAARRARLFGKTGLGAVPVVAGVWINTDAQAMADDYQVLRVIERRAVPQDAA